MNRRKFCYSLMALRGALSTSSLPASAEGAVPQAAIWDSARRLRFVLSDPLEHPYYWWPRTLLTYPIEFKRPADLTRLMLTHTGSGAKVPFQFTEVVSGSLGVISATLNFFSDLPSGGHHEFILSDAQTPVAQAALVSQKHEGDSIVLDSGAMRVRIPASQDVHGEAPGPVMQVSRRAMWFGESTLSFEGSPVTRITTKCLEDGSLVIAYEVAYEITGGSRYVTRIQCAAGNEFVRFEENMEAMQPGRARGLPLCLEGLQRHPSAVAESSVPDCSQARSLRRVCLGTNR